MRIADTGERSRDVGGKRSEQRRVVPEPFDGVRRPTMEMKLAVRRCRDAPVNRLNLTLECGDVEFDGAR
jgi:hypothetical protein